jgi:hypothetical protein
MRIVLKNTDEVFHFFANRVQEIGRSGSVSFSGDTFYSYAATIARRLPEKNIILLSEQNYSVTTSRHQSALRQAICNHGETVIYCYDVDGFHSNKTHYKTEIKSYTNKAATANKANRPKHLSTITATVEKFNRICDAFGRPEEKITVNLSDGDLLAVKNELKSEEKQRREEVEKKRQEAIQAAKELVIEWRDTDARGAIFSLSLRNIPPILKLSGDKEIIYTSWGAEVPTADAVRLWPFIQSAKSRSMRIAPTRLGTDATKIRLGHYTLNHINEDGSIQVGCHDITFSELEQIAKQLNLITEAGTETEKEPA